MQDVETEKKNISIVHIEHVRFVCAYVCQFLCMKKVYTLPWMGPFLWLKMGIFGKTFWLLSTQGKRMKLPPFCTLVVLFQWKMLVMTSAMRQK